jgi:hypothetical protein
MKLTTNQLKKIIAEVIQDAAFTKGDPELMLIDNELTQKALELGSEKSEIADQVLASLVAGLTYADALKLIRAISEMELKTGTFDTVLNQL